MRAERAGDFLRAAADWVEGFALDDAVKRAETVTALQEGGQVLAMGTFLAARLAELVGDDAAAVVAQWRVAAARADVAGGEPSPN